MAEPTDVEHLVKQLMAGASPEEGTALLDALMSGHVSSILEKLKRDEAPTLLPIPTEIRGFRVRLDLHGAKPPVWRRVELPGDLTLPRLHAVIQTSMGWCDSHLHRFRTRSDPRAPYFATAFDLDEGYDDEEGMLEDDVRLDQLLAAKSDELWYEYDFGDGWDHRLVVEEVLAEPPSAVRCTGGRMACPPEDCGGIGGYEQLAVWVRSGYDGRFLPDNFDDAAHAHEWLPLDWHPDHFDIDETNAALTVAVSEPVTVTGELADLAEQLDRRGIRLLREMLGRPLSHEPTEVTDAEAARITETYRIFLDVVGDGVTLTGAGYLPPAIVEQFAERSGITGWWIGKANREDLTPPVAEVHRTARALGLVSVRKGRLSPTAAAVRSRQDPQALRRHIAGRLPLGAKDFDRQSGWMALAAVGSGTPAQEWHSEIGDLMFALGWRDGYDKTSPPPARSATLDVLEHLAGAVRTRWRKVEGVDPSVAATARAAIRET
ncbi:plasmid pRiA4b ORF-3 family protein [Nocardioides sp. W7]|uniref:plasmid pRiA4b ORF-3 family protein n=1 Tax=Nocardioides sp. W7 TaxID=2931390 RepID=UPI001FD23671|nr:plasmid pRiA4b ORF-3 family protein [Nocardioides sp. W7]